MSDKILCVSVALGLLVISAEAVPQDGDRVLTVCSFNVHLLGNSLDRNDPALAETVQDCDIVAVQELVSPPFEGTFPDGDPLKPDPQSAEFFDAMAELGFDHWLSEEDTGTGDINNVNGAATDWWVAFYKEDKVSPGEDLAQGFLAEVRSNHPDYERVPYAFAFRTPDRNLDFVLISVNLRPGTAAANRTRRNQELSAIAAWIDDNDDTEKDFIILGNMNLYNTEEIENLTPDGYLSLNDEARGTNTNVRDPKPYDHVMYSTEHTTEIDLDFDLEVIDLIEAMRPFWDEADGEYPGDPYDHARFRRFYSDHHPIVFKMNVPEVDDD